MNLPLLPTFAATLAALPLLAASSASALDLLSTSVNEAQLRADSSHPSVSSDGRYVVFETWSALLPDDDNGVPDIYLKDRITREVTLVSRSSSGAVGNALSVAATISAEGGHVVFLSGATNLVAGDSNTGYDVFVRDLAAGTTTRMNVSAAGAQANDTSNFPPDISDDGSTVTFTTRATNLVASDTNSAPDVFVREVAEAATLILASLNIPNGNPANQGSSGAVISGNGKFVAFHSTATDLVAGDTNGRSDVFLYELSEDEVRMISADVSGNEGDGDSYDPALDGIGRFISFRSTATNISFETVSPFSDVFLHDTGDDSNSLISISTTGANADGASVSGAGAVSSDGRYVVFSSTATNLGGTFTDLPSHLYRRDRQTLETVCLTNTADGNGPNARVLRPAISADGETVVFDSQATNLVRYDASGFFADIYASPGTDLTRPPAVSPTARIALQKTIRTLKRKAKIAQRKDQTSKVKRFKKQIKKLTVQLRRL